jgi:hypothetical protein
MPDYKFVMQYWKCIVFLLAFFLFHSKSVQAQQLSPEEAALKEKLVQLLFNFDPAEWELLKPELRYKNFPVYALSYEAIREAYFRQERDESWVFSENDGPEVVKNRFDNYEKQEQELAKNSYEVKVYLESIGKLRVKEDYKRLKKLLDEYQPRIPDKNKLIFTLDKDRSVKSICYSQQAKKHSPLPENAENALVSFLKEKNYQTFETPNQIYKPNIFWLKNKLRACLNFKYLLIKPND